ncbi:DUF512 domain-containing protein [Gemmatimonadota bacterium]
MSLAASLDIRTGDELLAINGHPISDHIDFLFHASDVDLHLDIRRGSERLAFDVSCEVPAELGLQFEEMGPRICGDDCVFCFIDQNPPGVRASLRVKDEDYRLSFLHGNYVTLDNLSRSDFQRILDMRLSPLYVSVHTTDPDLRSRMLRGRRSAGLLERLDRLIDGSIRIHAQIVLVPEWNDGEHLRRTVTDLADRFPGVESIAVVPVGLTDHREGLSTLRRPTVEEMRGIIDTCEQWREDFRERLGNGFIYLADEFYLFTGVPLPEVSWYDDFPQMENGVGMGRAFVSSFEERYGELLDDLGGDRIAHDRPMRVYACTGGMGHELFDRHLTRQLDPLEGLSFSVLEVENTLFGRSVTTTGLLSSNCLHGALSALDLTESDNVLLPPNCLNDDGLFLDDVSLDEFSSRWPCRVEQGSYDLVEDLLALSRADRSDDS